MTDAPRIGLIWAQAEGGVIGRDGGMPWHVPEDLARFKEITSGSPVVMGRATWDSLNPRWRPLPERRNIVVTRQAEWSADGAEPSGSVEQAIALAGADRPQWIWIIGGGTIFDSTMGVADRLEVTELRHPSGFAPLAGDVHAPEIDPTVFTLTDADPRDGSYASRSGIRYRFLRYERSASA
jgi:dihydrofolate reductase